MGRIPELRREFQAIPPITLARKVQPSPDPCRSSEVTRLDDFYDGRSQSPAESPFWAIQAIQAGAGRSARGHSVDSIQDTISEP